MDDELALALLEQLHTLNEIAHTGLALLAINSGLIIWRLIVLAKNHKSIL